MADENVLTTEAQRIDAILNGLPGQIVIDTTTMRTDEAVNAYPPYSSYLGLDSLAKSVISSNEEAIRTYSERYGISEDLLKAVIYLETSHSIQDIIRSPWLNGTLTPANVNPEIWGNLLGYDENDMLDPAKNIELAARVLAELQSRIENPTPAAIATLYNSTSQDKLNAYGVEVSITCEIAHG